MATWAEVCDQWRLDPAGRAIGLDWPAVKVLIDAGGGRLDVDVRRALRVMERTSRQIWDERRPTQ